MKIRKSKKSQVIIYGLLAGLLVALLIAYLDTSTTKKAFPIIGESSKKLIESSNKAEKSILYTEQAAKNSVHQSIYDLAQDGGCKKSEKNSGYSIFDENCKSQKDTLKGHVGEKLNAHIDKYMETNLLKNNYDYIIENNYFLGTARNPIEIIITDGKGEIGKQIIRPNFKVNLNNYDFSDYSWLQEQSEKIKSFVRECTEQGQTTENCVGLSKLQGFFTDIEANKLELIENAQCETEEKRAFLQFIDYFSSCTSSEDNDCACREGMPEEGKYEIIKKDSGAEIKGKINGKEFLHNISKIDIEESLENIDKENILHRTSSGVIASLDPAADVFSEILGGEAYREQFPSCSYRPKTTFRFCVQNNENKFLSYDQDERNTALRNVVYKFALDFGNTTKETGETSS